MKKKIIISCIAIILLTCSLIIAYQHVQKDLQIKKVNESEINTINKLNEINLYVSKLISYGKGPVIEGRFPTEKEILEYGEGHCGEYAYLFSKYISKLGVNYKVIDIHRFDSNAHSVVEVSVNNHNYVFDPTMGIYYKASIDELINKNELDIDKVRIGYPIRDYLYGEEIFFKGIQNYNIYTDVRDYYEINKIINTPFISKTNISSKIPFEKNEVVNNEQEKILEINFGKKISFYSTKLYFSDMMDDVEKIKISYLDTEGQEQILYDDLVSENSCLFEFTNSDDIEANNIKYKFYMKNEEDIPDIEKICLY